MGCFLHFIKAAKDLVEGGSAITLCAAPVGMGGSWGEDGNIIASLSSAGGLSQIPPPEVRQHQ